MAESNDAKLNRGKRMALEEENKILLARVNCVKCSTAKRNVVFLPCRHVEVCQECAQDIDKCTKCGGKIETTKPAITTAEFPDRAPAPEDPRRPPTTDPSEVCGGNTELAEHLKK